jgi:hypothetical protein
VNKRIGSYPRVRVRDDGGGVVSQAGGVLLVETVRKSGLDTAISAALAPWRKPRAVHDPGKILLDVALAVALGGDCLSDVPVLRAEPAVFGPVASDPTVSRLVDTLAGAGSRALDAVRRARAEVREQVWKLAGTNAPDANEHVVVDIDGVLVLAHSEKQDATATWKKTFGHHPLVAFVDHGQEGSGEPVAAPLRPGNTGSNTASDHIATTKLALAQMPKRYRRGRQTLIRTDSAGGTHEFLAWLTRRGRWLSYSVGMTITAEGPSHRRQINRTMESIACRQGPGPAQQPLPERPPRRPHHHAAMLFLTDQLHAQRDRHTTVRGLTVRDPAVFQCQGISIDHNARLGDQRQGLAPPVHVDSQGVLRDHCLSEVERHLAPVGGQLQPPRHHPTPFTLDRAVLLVDPEYVLDLCHGRVGRERYGWQVNGERGQFTHRSRRQSSFQALVQLVCGQHAVPRRDTQHVHHPVTVRMRGPQRG